MKRARPRAADSSAERTRQISARLPPSPSKATLEDARAAIDAARAAFDSNVGNWIYNYKLREQALFRTARLIRDNADRLARVVSLEVGMPMRQAVPHVAADGRHLRVLRRAGRQAVWRELHPAQRLHDQPGQGAGGRGGDDHPLELPVDSDRAESGPGPRRRLHHRDQAGELYPGRHLRSWSSSSSDTGLPKGVLNLVPGPGASSARRSSPTRRWTRSPSPARRAPAR